MNSTSNYITVLDDEVTTSVSGGVPLIAIIIGIDIGLNLATAAFAAGAGVSYD